MSEQYIVSARKYRPQTFETVVGQGHITTTLKNAIRNNHLAHAYLFCGPRGVGKTTCARILAKTINCENPTPDTEACGVCPTCVSFNNNASFNVFELDAASNNSVEDIRTLTDQVRFAPQQGKYKIYIIDEVHMLSTAAFNAFLKTLEEPPSYAIFILATTEKHKILPTILSRCQIFDFKRITTNDTVEHLHNIAVKEGVQADDAALHIIAQKSEGCMRDALSILDRISSFTNGHLTYSSTMEHLNQLDADFYFRITDSILAQDVSGTLLQLDEVMERGFEGDIIINGFGEHFRNLLLCKDARMAKLLDVPNDHRPIYHEKARQTPPSFILSALNVVNESELSYKNANNRRLHTELCLIRLCYVLQASTAIANEKKNNKPDISAPIAATNNTPTPIPTAAPAATPAVPPPVSNITAPTEKIPEEKTNIPIAAEPMVAYNHQQTAPVINPFGRNDATGGTTARRVTRNMLHNVPATASDEKNKLEFKDMGIEQIQALFDQYKDILRSENKSTLHTQFSLMKIELVEEGMMCIISPNNITDAYAQTERTSLQEFIKKETGLLFRITTTFTETEVEHKERALSKGEIFNEMVAKNPVLLHLRDALKMGIDY